MAKTASTFQKSNLKILNISMNTKSSTSEIVLHFNDPIRYDQTHR